MNQDIRNYNEARQWHGYQESYNGTNSALVVRGTWKTDRQFGYVEWHAQMIQETIYFIR